MPSHRSTAPSRSRWLALVVLCAGMLMIILDGTIVNVALPAIQGDLGFSQSNLAWVMNAYLIAFGGLLLLAGRVGDLVGRRRVFLAGLVLFTLASALCGVSTSAAMLIGARFLQGIGGAMASAVILGMIVSLFPEGRERTKAIGVYSFVASAGASIGLLLGGVLTQGLSWHWIFFVNVPIGVVAFAAALRLLRPERGLGLRAGADVLGAVLVTSAVMVVVFTIVGAASSGWTSARTLGLGALGVALLAATVVRLLKARNPLLPVRILASRNVAGGNVVQMLMVAGMFGMFFLGALYLQRVLHFDEVQTGLAFLPVSVGIGVLSFQFAEKLVTRLGARRVLLGGLSLILAGLLLLVRVPVQGHYLVDLLPSMLLFGVGAGASFPALMTLLMSGATDDDSGTASGLANMTLQVGGAIGLSVLTTFSASHTQALLERGVPAAPALAGGFHLAFAIGAAFVLAALALTAVVLRPEPATEPEGAAYPEPEAERVTDPVG
jgi:EmrB/QacA subfamily drug resistance transporter